MLDLRQQLTVFVTTVGAPTFARCLRHLDEQESLFERRILRHIAPMSAAFQQMLDLCATPYFVQVDEDMLLVPNAVGILYQRLHEEEPNVAMYAADLFDTHLQRCLFGVKIFRHGIAKRYPLGNSDTFEIDQLVQMTDDGFGWRKAEIRREPVYGQTLGLHEVDRTPLALYRRYARLGRRARERPGRMGWFEGVPTELLQRFLQNSSDDDFYALQGLISGYLLAGQPASPAVDYRSSPGRAFESIEELVAQLRLTRG